MAILVADNFQYQGRKPLDSRIIVDTIADMKGIAESIIYEGILVYNKETKKFYQFDPANTVDATLGKWREFSSGGGGNAQISEYAQDTDYKTNALIIHDNKLYLATADFTSDNTAATADDSFDLDIAANNLVAVTAESDAVLEEDVQANIAIGAAPANFKYPQGMTFTEFVKKIALKDMLAVVNFVASGAGLHKTGTTVNGSTLTATLTNLGNVAINKIKFYKGNTQVDDQNYVSGTTVYTNAQTDPITTNTTFAVVVEQDKGYTVRKEASIKFVNPTYIGVVNTLTPTAAEITAFPENLKESFKGTYTVSMADQRTCFSYPASMGNVTSIKDKNNFEYIGSFTKTTATINGELYNVYVLTDPVTATNFTWIFN